MKPKTNNQSWKSFIEANMEMYIVKNSDLKHTTHIKNENNRSN